MANKMLIDATHPEETRVVVTRGSKVEEFDYESAARKQLRGSIYLAKVARIEPSLQAAFVNYGGNRHGFLAFAEIHPDYYQVPVAVREAMLREEALDRQGNRPTDALSETSSERGEAEEAGVADEQALANGSSQEADASAGADVMPASEQPLDDGEKSPVTAMPLEAILPPVIYEQFSAAVARGQEAADEIPAHPDDVEGEPGEAAAEESDGDAEADGLKQEEGSSADADGAPDAETEAGDTGRNKRQSDSETDTGGESGVISVPEAPAQAPLELGGSDDAMEEVPQRAKRRWRQYKIQEVIKRNQIVLVQVVKEERGTKGAALTTYLSLAGRYTVLMPNTASGGGISRKITVPADRKRLKEIAQELEVPEGMGLIIRTAGASRTKAEIKRDFEYLLRLWENVRDLTLKSSAPCLVYEEGDLIKRSIRDLYNKDIDEILVAGEKAHADAREFMRMLMPSHAKNVILYQEPEPLFTRYEVERQLNQMFSPVVTLKSGGYIVLNQTEALVAIDVNSGRATREFSIEDTALKTNLEAAEEVARQVRLRDLAGLIVIDFIDMDERRNNRAVERRMKECLRHDRARIQVGHISHFGLLEMSRQRLRQGVVEVSTMPCPICQGVGHIRSIESVALMILRSIEDHLRTQGAANITASAAAEAALYILNHKRTYLRDIEARYNISIVIAADEKARGAHFSLERGAEVIAPVSDEPKVVHMHAGYHQDQEEAASDKEAGSEDEKRSSRRKRRRRRGSRGEGDDFAETSARQNGAGEGHKASWRNGKDHHEGEPSEADGAEADVSEEGQDGQEATEQGADGAADERFRRQRRRGRRGGRRHRGQEGASENGDTARAPVENVPGMGEQPAVNLDGMLYAYPTLRDRNSASARAEPAAESGNDAKVDGKVAAAVIEPQNAKPKEKAPAAKSVAIAIEVSASEPIAVPPALEIAKETAIDAIEESQDKAAATPPAPKPRPVRTSPARKGWWQRNSG